jgi:hypothetical protein
MEFPARPTCWPDCSSAAGRSGRPLFGRARPAADRDRGRAGSVLRRSAVRHPSVSSARWSSVRFDAKSHELSRSGSPRAAVVGRHHDGVAVLARDPYRIEDVERSGPCYLSTIVGGPGGYRFRFVGFWAMTPTSPEDGYPQQARELVDGLPHDELATVVAGDFNASSRNAHHLENVALLGARGLVNAYNAIYGAPAVCPGDHPTSYHLWNEARPHHMDYVFLPRNWDIEDVQIGTFAEYSATRRSDHIPVTVVSSPR